MATSFVIDNLPGKIRICATDATGRYQVAEIPRTPGGMADDEKFCDAICALDAVMFKYAVPAVSVYPDPTDL